MLGSFKGPGIRLVAGILGLAALIFGIWVTFFQSAGFVKTSAKIVSIEKDPDYVPDTNSENDERLIATVKYHVDGIDYFIPQEYEVIRRLMLHSKGVYITVSGNFKDASDTSKFDPFYEQKRTVTKLKETAAELNVPVYALRQWVKSGEVPAVYSGKKALLNLDLVVKFLNGGEGND